MTKSIKLLIALAITVTISACASTKESKDYTAFREANPRSVVIVPVINHSTEALAADLFLSTLSQPLAERGYYVFPNYMVKHLMESDGLADPMLVHTANPSDVASLFGADTVFYVEILDWTAKYALVSSGINVHFIYSLRDGKTGQLLWQDEEAFFHQTSGGSGNIFADMITAAITTAVDNARADYTPAANAATNQAIALDGQGLPFGPYADQYQKDTSQFPSSGSGVVSDATTKAVFQQ
ncbi:MAG: hypothetical protein CMF31_02005 [Kordiimonas sp.]|nr:hypothetical protein [Kordiimonas sp.]|tara:strand:+ start:995 stop:1714 length:720 start_codon:yes stop_codon:yes gene_type:complete